VIIFSNSEAEHKKHLELVFQKLQDANLKMNREKCEFFQRKRKFLGHIISDKGILPDPEKAKAIVNCKAPTCLSELESFLGLANYCRRFVKNFGTIVEP
jgi:hypothetical protein